MKTEVESPPAKIRLNACLKCQEVVFDDDLAAGEPCDWCGLPLVEANYLSEESVAGEIQRMKDEIEELRARVTKEFRQ